MVTDTIFYLFVFLRFIGIVQSILGYVRPLRTVEVHPQNITTTRGNEDAFKDAFLSSLRVSELGQAFAQCCDATGLKMSTHEDTHPELGHSRSHPLPRQLQHQAVCSRWTALLWPALHLYRTAEPASSSPQLHHNIWYMWFVFFIVCA